MIKYGEKILKFYLFYSFFTIFYHFEQEKTKKNLGKYITLYPKGEEKILKDVM
jgi:hypothetical protein